MSADTTAERLARLEKEVDKLRLENAELTQKGQLADLLLNNIREVFYVKDLVEEQYTYVSPIIEEVFGFPAEKLLEDADYLLKVLHPDDQEIYLSARERQKQGKEYFDKDYRIVKEDGTHRWIHAQSFPIHDENSAVTRLVGIAEDITERKRAEKTLAESEERFRVLTEQSLLGIVIIQDGLVKYVNQAACGITGYSVEEALNWEPNGFAKLFHPDDIELVMEQAQKKQKGDKDVLTHYSYRIITKSGELKWVDQYSKTIPFEGKNADFITLIDITERKLGEEALKESQARYRLLFESANDIIFLHPLILEQGQGTFVDVNETACQVLGYSKNELCQLSPLDIISESDKKQIPDEAHTLEAEGKLLFEKMLIAKNGKQVPVEIHAHVFDLNGQPIVLSIARDITERKRTELALRASEERYRSLVGVSPDAITLTDLNANIIMANQQAAWLHGFADTEEMLSSVKSAFNLVAPQDRQRAMDNLQEALETGIVRNLEFTFLRKDGSSFPAALSAALINGAEGNPKAFTTVTRDITEQKRFNEELERRIEQRTKELKETQAQLFQTSKLAMLGEMATGIAHEISHPLSGISLTATYLRKLMERGKLSPEEIASGLDDIEASIKRMVNIIRHIRTFARQETLAFNQVDVNETIASALRLLGEQLRLHEIEVAPNLRPDLPQMVGEPYQLEQVWMNLITNAKDAMDEKEEQMIDYQKSLNISTSYNPESKLIEISFSDNGMGMSKEVEEKIFEPFFTTKEVGKATGLGLSISYGIIENHKGKIEVESKEGEGTTLKVKLPLEVDNG
jgi:PAS domain S-box-containing protein